MRAGGDRPKAVFYLNVNLPGKLELLGVALTSLGSWSLVTSQSQDKVGVEEASA